MRREDETIIWYNEDTWREGREEDHVKEEKEDEEEKEEVHPYRVLEAAKFVVVDGRELWPGLIILNKKLKLES